MEDVNKDLRRKENPLSHAQIMKRYRARKQVKGYTVAFLCTRSRDKLLWERLSECENRKEVIFKALELYFASVDGI